MRMFVFLAMQICVKSWASYYKLSDHCKKPLVQGETIMGKEVEVSEDRHITLLDAEGTPLECGKATIQPGKTIQASLSNPSEPAQYSEVRPFSGQLLCELFSSLTCTSISTFSNCLGAAHRFPTVCQSGQRGARTSAL
jgi:hypothetical protein